jgi:hypothetical protein
MIRLRGHHLLCALNYSGSGYTPEFISNFDEVCAALSAGVPALLVWGDDSICGPMENHPEKHCHHLRIHLRDFLGFVSTSLSLRRLMWPGMEVVITKDMVERMRHSFQGGKIRMGCIGCEWFSHCTKNAANGYLSSKLHSRNKDGA